MTMNINHVYRSSRVLVVFNNQRLFDSKRRDSTYLLPSIVMDV